MISLPSVLNPRHEEKYGPFLRVLYYFLLVWKNSSRGDVSVLSQYCEVTTLAPMTTVNDKQKSYFIVFALSN